MLGSIVLAAVIAYLIGSINFSVIFTKRLKGFDVREKGSGNAGSTNVLRTAGPAVALLTLVCDIAKGVVAILVAILIGNIAGLDDNSKAILAQIAGLLVVIGHTFPVFFGFKGGKGVATSLGVLLTINWQVGLVCLAFALITMALTRMVSLGSVMAAILFPTLLLFGIGIPIVPGNYWSYLVFAIILGALVVFNHRSNIERIMNGNENRLTFKK